MAGWSLAGLAAVLLLVGLVIGGLLGTVSGSRWLLAQAPGVQVEAFQGRLGGNWQAEQLRWSQGESSVVVQQPRLNWSAGCLLRMTLCIDELSANGIDLVFPPGPEEKSSEPFRLPDIQLPLALRVLQVDLGPLRLNGDELLQRLQLRADWRRDGLDISQLQVHRTDMSLSLAGRLQPSGAWPLALKGDAALRFFEEQPWTLKFDVQGELRERVALNVNSAGYLDGNLNGRLQPLASGLPATLKLTLDDFKASPELPDSLRLDGFVLTAEGELEEGYRLLGSGRLAGEGGAVGLSLDGKVNQAGARLDKLELVAGEQQRVELAGQLDWREALQGEAALSWQEFPWWRLYPQPEQQPPVVLRTLTAQLQYDAGNYLGHFDAALSGPAGDFTLKSPVSGDMERVHLPQLQLQAGQGEATGNLAIGFADGVDWRTSLELRDVDPSYWLAELPGQLGGTLNSQGALRGKQLEASVVLAMDGRLRGQPTRLRLEASGRDARWGLPSVSLQLGDNRIQGSGQWAETLEGQLRLDMPALGQLWPGLAGRLTGDLSIAGTPAVPQGRVELEGRGIGYQDNRVQQLQLAASLLDGERARIRLTANGLQAGDTELGQLQLSADGTRGTHQATLDLQGGLLDLSLAAAGNLQGGDWRGRLVRASVEASGHRWALQRPVAINRLASGRLDMAAHCFVSGPATLCAPEQRLMPDTQLRYRLRDFPLDSLAAYLPDTLVWQGELNADLKVDLPQAGPTGEISVDAGAGTLRFREGDVWHDFPYQALVLNSRLRPERVDSRLRFAGGELGELDVQLRIDPQGAKPIDGEFRLSDLDISVARPFVPQVDRLQGQLNGSGQFSGTLERPQLNGALRLREAEISGSELPVSFEQLQMDIAVEGQQLRVDGNWRSGEQGQGRLNGTLDWRGAVDLDLHLAGTRLPVVVEPYAQLEVEPDLHLALANDRLRVSGRVKVPRGDITVRELPPSTVQVSKDTVIVGEDASKDDKPLAVGMDIDVVVGEDRLRFSAFGLTADLAGNLHIGDNLDARGELNLNNGRYRAYGQNLTIRRAQLLFTGILSQPFLDIEAIRQISEDDVIAGLRITGSAEEPSIKVFAEPAMSQEQALSYLVLGRALGADTGDSNLLASAALSLGLAGSASITGGLASRLGIDDFQLDTEGSGAKTSVVASGRLTERLTLSYGVGVFEPANTVALRYQLTRRIFLEAASGLASSLDLFYRRNF